MKDIASHIRLKEEKELLNYMEERVNAPVIQKLLSVKDRAMPGSSFSSYLKGYHLPLSEHMGKDICTVCRSVQEKVGFGDTGIDFFISSNPEVDAASYFNVNYSKRDPHCIILNSGLLELLNQNELEFVIGHEIGHLMYEHTSFRRLIEFIYPGCDKMPFLLRNLYDFWCKLGEISADRIGLLAVKNVETAIAAMFKISSGLGSKYLNFQYQSFNAMIDSMLDGMSETASHTFNTHPTNPVRAKAVRLFSESATWKAITKGKALPEDKELTSKINALVDLLKKSPGSEVEGAALDFLTSAGYILIVCDNEQQEVEVDYLLNLLSQYLYMPQGHIQGIAKKADTDLETMKKSSAFIVENYPEQARVLYQSLLPLIMRDRKLNQKEVDILLRIGVEELKIPFQEAVDLLLEAISQRYSPLT